ncbi:hypothetical protein [Trichothermofontia sp.]
MITITLPVNTTLGERVPLRGLTWPAYQQILRALPQTRNAKPPYDRGTLEITSLIIDYWHSVPSRSPSLPESD